MQLGFISVLLLGGACSGMVRVEDGMGGAFAAALAIPLTDFLVGQSASLKRHVLCPVVDYLNHDSKTVSEISFEYFSNCFAVRVRGGFASGEQICINYGDRRSNDALLQYYGFVESDCPNDVYRMDLVKHLDPQAAAAGQVLMADLSRTGPEQRVLDQLYDLIQKSESSASPRGQDVGEMDALVWEAIIVACEAEMEHREKAFERLSLGASPVQGLLRQFCLEKEKVLRACCAYARACRGRPASSMPVSLSTQSPVIPTFEDPMSWCSDWADATLQSSHAAELRESGFCVIPSAFDVEFAFTCRAECEELDAQSAMVTTTNECNRGSRSTWLEFSTAQDRELAQTKVPALLKLSKMLAGLPSRIQMLDAKLGHTHENFQVHAASMIAVYPEQAADYSIHKDSYAPKDNDPATGATRQLTILAYFNDWRESDGGELLMHSAANDMPDPRRSLAIPPKAGSLVIFESRRMWHAVAPSLRGPRWALTLWVH